jgi:hypothetical protein
MQGYHNRRNVVLGGTAPQAEHGTQQLAFFFSWASGM